jgi:hypothetical protein
MTDQRKRIACTAAILVLLSALPAAPQQAGSAAPNGTYLKTCSKIYFDGKTLTATCRWGGSFQFWDKTSITVAMCDGGDIWNNRGALYCYARRGTWGDGTVVPRGSYLDSCGGENVHGTVLEAACKNRSGEPTPTSLQLNNCRMGSNISNIDGQLVCIN